MTASVAVPHNPLVNAGAIMCCSLIEEGTDMEHKMKTVLGYWKRLIGHKNKCEINQDMYQSESSTADRNRCLAYMMNEAKAFPKKAVLEQELEFYFMCCSQMQNTESMAIVAATLANGGCCPTTNERIFSPETVQASYYYDKGDDWYWFAIVGINFFSFFHFFSFLECAVGDVYLRDVRFQWSIFIQHGISFQIGGGGRLLDCGPERDGHLYVESTVGFEREFGAWDSVCARVGESVSNAHL